MPSAINIYELLRWNKRNKRHRIKFIALYFFHRFKKRYLAVNLDPVMACNLRCKMCYFTDKDYVKTLKGQLTSDEVKRIAEVIFPRALKLQIGCGTEPTLYKNLPEIIGLGKQYNVPYISLTTNANLLTENSINAMLHAGLNEFTVSLHGVEKRSYEDFMGKGDYERFQDVFQIFIKLKQRFDFKVRVNYTFNEDNFLELNRLFEQFNPDSIDILQIRPIQNLGNTAYQNFSLDKVKSVYPKVYQQLKDECNNHGIVFMAPERLSDLEKVNESSIIFDYTYCYISPNKFFRKGFKWKEESFENYTHRMGWGKQLLKNAFKSKRSLKTERNHLNYDVNFN
ncbi:radical SAM protein [Aegicerativicinus sediminis]